MESRDVTDDVTNRCTICTFLWDPYWTRTPKSLNFRIVLHRSCGKQTDIHIDTSIRVA